MQLASLQQFCVITYATSTGLSGGGEEGRAGSALRDALEQTKDMPATQGVYNMTPADHSGFDERGRELIVVKDGKWTLIQ